LTDPEDGIIRVTLLYTELELKSSKSEHFRWSTRL